MIKASVHGSGKCMIFLTANADRRAVRFTLAEKGRREGGGTLSSTSGSVGTEG